MRSFLLACTLLTALPVHAKTWTFDSDKADEAPPGFRFGRTGHGRPGRWVVRAVPDAPSAPNVLAQVDEDGTDYRFPVAVAPGFRARDLRLSVKCKQVSGKVDQACGLVFRFRSAKNYYVVRANALENNIRLYHVKRGRRRMFGSFPAEVTAAGGTKLRSLAP